MQFVARALRGPSWLAWLSLLFATQIGTGDAVAWYEPDEVQDRAAIHAPMCPRPFPLLVGSSPDEGRANQDELRASPAVLELPLKRPVAAYNRAVDQPVPFLHPSAAFVHLSSRAPPLPRSL